MNGSAIISDCGKYRYRLERAIAGPFISDVDGILSGKTVAFFGVNPSTVDACKWPVATQGRALSRRRKNLR